MAKKLSLFQRLTGGVTVDDDIESSSDDTFETGFNNSYVASGSKASSWDDETENAGEVVEAEAQLTVDVHQTDDAVIVKTMAAGVKPDDLDISITRDTVTIRGVRENEHEIEEGDFYHQELYWGAFSRTILLPCEIEAEEAEAVERHGLLVITLPKIDKHKQTKLKVVSGK